MNYPEGEFEIMVDEPVEIPPLGSARFEVVDFKDGAKGTVVVTDQTGQEIRRASCTVRRKPEGSSL